MTQYHISGSNLLKRKDEPDSEVNGEPKRARTDYVPTSRPVDNATDTQSHPHDTSSSRKSTAKATSPTIETQDEGSGIKVTLKSLVSGDLRQELASALFGAALMQAMTAVNGDNKLAKQKTEEKPNESDEISDEEDREPPDVDADKEFEAYMVKPKHIREKFDHIHATDEVIKTLKRLAEPLRDPKAYKVGIFSRSRGSGVLIYGPPGTGKTMLARALAKEGGMRMVAISYGDLENGIAGKAESKINRLFAYARRHHPCIIFIDEADACFRSRTAQSIQSHHITFLNQFLTEMDGISARPNRMPIVVAATNHPANIDEGILRRLSHRIMVGLPDVRGREAILRLHLRGEKVDPSENLDSLLPEIARSTHDYTGCDLRDLVERAALEAMEEIYRKEEAAGRPRLGGP